MHDTPEHQPDPELSPELLLSAYAQGCFPMADPETGEINWYCPNPRGVIPLDAFHVPASLRRVVRSRRFIVQSDTAFEQVMRECAAPRRDDAETWIDDRIVQGYTALHQLGFAHSVEAWRDGRLVGGLYGVALGGAFFGESMFSRPALGGTDASKVCLVHLVAMLRRQGFTLLDTQFTTNHLAQFGCTEISRREYLQRLARAMEQECEWGDVSEAP